MNRVEFSMPARGIRIQKLLVPPKNRTEIRNWVKAARRVIPQIPDVLTRNDWSIFREVISDNHIMIEIRDTCDNKCALVIERRTIMTM